MAEKANTQPGKDRRQSNLLKQRAVNQRRRVNARASGNEQQITNTNEDLQRIKTGLSDPSLPLNQPDPLEAPQQPANAPAEEKRSQSIYSSQSARSEQNKVLEDQRTERAEADKATSADKARTAAPATSSTSFAQPKDVFEERYNENVAQIEDDYASTIQILDAMKGLRDERSRNQLDEIRRVFEERRQSQMRHNKEVMGGAKKAGARSGRARYATEVQQGIISDVEQKGLNALNKLAGEEQSLLMQVRMAAEQGDLEDMLKKQKMLMDKRIEKNGAFDRFQAEIQQAESNRINQEKTRREEVRFERETQEYERESFVENADVYATAIMGSFYDSETGAFEAPDQAYLEAVANEAGVPYEFIASSVNNKLQEMEKLSQEQFIRQLDIAKKQQDLLKSQFDGDVGEYEDAKNAGVVPEGMGFFDYIQSKKVAGTAPTKIAKSSKISEWEQLGGEAGTGLSKADYVMGGAGEGGELEEAVDGSLYDRFQKKAKKAGLTSPAEIKKFADDMMKASFKTPTEAQGKALKALYTATNESDLYNETLAKVDAVELSDSIGFIKRELGDSESPLTSEVVNRLIDDPNIRTVINSELRWTAAVLREESGAAITVGEYLTKGSQFFPRKGDDSTEIANKERARGVEERGLRAKIGPAGERVFEEELQYREENQPDVDYKVDFQNYFNDEIGDNPQLQAELSEKLDILMTPYDEGGAGLTENQARAQVMGIDFSNVGGDTYQASPVISSGGVDVYETPEGMPASSPSTLLNGMEIITDRVAPSLSQFAKNCVFFARSIVKNIPTGAINVAGRKEGLKKAEEGGYGSTEMAGVQVGDAIHTTEGNVGHTAIVKAVVDGMMILDEANYKTGQVTTGRQLAINDPVNLGWIRPEGSVAKKNPKRFANNPKEGDNKAILKQIEQIKKKSRLKFIS